jgi:WD40 repeat protein/serine/threonine protein kinase/class 3 adenylate cyclase
MGGSLPETAAHDRRTSSAVRTFLIADLRGYTRFSDARGDAAAARLTTRFLTLAREAVSARTGKVLEVRGDEVLAVFDSPREAIVAAVSLRDALEGEATPELPLLAGIGIDAGEAVAVDGGFRGRALNMAARLCARARPGEILVTPELAHVAGSVEGLLFEDRGPVRLKGISRPIRLNAVVPTSIAAPGERRSPLLGGIELNILGPLEVLEEGRPVELGGPKRRLILAYLILRANHVVPVEALVDGLWGDDPPASARGAIQSHISHLRTALGAERLEGRAPGYVLHAETHEVDVLRFEGLLRRARRALATDPVRAASTFEEALALWRGPPLADLADAPGLSGETSRLEELHLSAVEDLLGTRLAVGDQVDVIAELEGLTRQHPRRERLWGHLMLALYRSGRQSEALDAFGRARSILAGELDIDPSAELRELQERILRQDPSLDLRGRALRSYRLLEPIGEGSSGVVWRALDPGVGREVAVKQIQPRFAHGPDFVRRFDQEAQSVARIEHPYVVPLYDYWRDGSGAYLVMRLMRGGSLAEAIASGPLPVETCVGVLDHVASALAAAHRRKLVHRDIRPENVLLDEEGNAYLADFGLAMDETALGRAGSSISGPGFRSPEQLRGEDATERSDLYALGMLLYAMLVGERSDPRSATSLGAPAHGPRAMPAPSELRPEIPSAVDEIWRRATDPDTAVRFSDAGELSRSFRAAVGAVGARVDAAEPSVGAPTDETAAATRRNPYKGLRPFSEADAGDFRGRSALVARLVERLGGTGPEARFLAVVGPSGSGKSSVVRAGLLPALRSGAVEGSDRWFYAEMLPGPRPMEELEAALQRVAVDPSEPLLDALEQSERGLTTTLDRMLPEDELLLLVDQFEEVFTLVEDEALRVRFLESLVSAVADRGSRLRIVATIRADFYDRPLAYPGLAELIRSRTEIVVPLTSEELERAIAGPAEAVGVTTELSLIAEIVGDVTDQPGALPLMQYALTETFERRRDGTLELEAYRAAGGVTGAIARRAEDLYTALNGAGRDAARQLFLRLVSIGEGVEDTRRLVPRDELGTLEVDPEAMDGVIEVFGRHRLLSFDRDPDSRGPTVEVAHEALLREWGRLRGWIDAARADVIMRRRLAAEAEEWERSARDPSFLLRGSRLAQFEVWGDATVLALAAGEREYLTESVRAREEERRQHQVREEHERALERRSRTRLRALVAALTAAVVVATTLTVIALGQRGRAERQGRVATARELAAASTANLPVDPQLSILLAMAAVDATQGDEAVLPEAEQALHDAVEADRELLTLVDLSTGNVAWSPDGRLLLTGGTAGGKEGIDAILWDSQSGEEIQRLSSHTADLNYVAFSPDSTRVVTAADDQKGTFVWDIASGDVRTEIPLAEEGILAGARFAPDGARIVIGELPTGPDGNVVGGIVRVVDAESGAETLRVDQPWGMCTTPLMSPDGTRIAVARDRTVILDARTGREVLSLDAFCPQEMAYSPDGTRLVTSDDGRVHVWDLRDEGGFDRVPEARILSPANATGVDWSSDGDLIATGGSDGVARVFDAETGEEVLSLPGHRGLIALVSFNPDGTRLLTGGTDGTARVWDVSRAGTAERLGVAEPSALHSVAYHPDGGSLLTTEFYGRGWLWDADTGSLVRGYRDAWDDGMFGPDGDTVAFLGGKDRVFIARTDPGVVESDFPTHGDDENWPNALTLSGDGSRVAVAGQLGTAAVFDASTGRTLYTLGEPSNARDSMSDVAFAPGGDLLAGLSGLATLYVWDTSSGEELVRVQSGGGIASSVTFSPDGSKIATAGGDGATVLSASGRELVSMGGVGFVESVAFSPDGSQLATGTDDGIAYLWDAETGEELLALRGHTGAIKGIAFRSDGSELATASEDGTLRVFTLDVDELVALARSRLSRGLTEVECRQYLHVDRCPDTGASPASPEPPDLPESPVPEGAFRVELEREDFPSPPFRPNDHRWLAGVYTWYLEGDTWRFHLRSSNGDVDDWSGTIERSGDRVTFITERGLPECVGYSFSGRLVPDGPSDVRFMAAESIELPGCGDELPIGGWVQALAVHQWERVGWTP